jgi:rhamnulokinase
VRAIYVSLARRYKQVLERLEAAAGRDVRTIHVIGGGARNELLCRLTADVTGREVLAGPVEATALGNVLVQARAAGELGSFTDMRAVSAASVEPVRFQPSREEISL